MPILVEQQEARTVVVTAVVAVGGENATGSTTVTITEETP
jgi:hypothetical protein